MSFVDHGDAVPRVGKLPWLSFGSHPLAISFVGLLAGLVYLNTLSHGFVWDDQTYVLDNPQFKMGENLLHYFVSDFCEGVNEHCYFYRPVIALTYLLDYTLWGNEPFGFHLTNVIWHILVSLLVYGVGWHLFRNWSAALIGAGLFAVHPIHTESIAFVAGRTDPPATFFYLLAFILFVRSSGMGGREGYFYRIASLFSFVLALMSKEVAVTLPLILVAYSLFYPLPIRERAALWARLRPSIPYWVLVMGYLLMRRFILGEPFSSDSILIELPRRLLTLPLLLLDNLRMLIVPWPLEVFRGAPQDRGFGDPLVIGTIPLFLVIVWALFRFGRSSRETLFGSIWIFITLLPVLNLVPTHWPSVWDRFLYLPSVGLCLMVGWWGSRVVAGRLLNGDLPTRLVWVTGSIGLFLLFIGMTIDRNRDWRDNVALWEVTAQQVPSGGKSEAAVIARNNLALAYRDQGDLSKAAMVLEEALRRNPNFHTAGINLGNVYALMGKHQESLQVYQSVLDAMKELSSQDGEGIDKEKPKRPGSAKLYYNLGVTYSGLGDLDRALDAYERSRALNPRDHLVHNALGNLYSKRGRIEDAEKAFLESVQLRPGFGMGYKNLGSIYVRQGKLQEAARAYESALRFEPEDVKSYQNLGWTYYHLGKLALATRAFERGLRLSPSDVSLHYNLGLAYQKLGYLEPAMKEYQQALLLEPMNPEIHNNLGSLLEAWGDPKGALEEYEQAVSLRPDYMTAQINIGRMLAETGKREKALQQYRLVLKKLPIPLEGGPEGRFVLEQIKMLEDQNQTLSLSRNAGPP